MVKPPENRKAEAEKTRLMRQFDVWLAQLPEPEDGSHIIKGCRPVVVVSNNLANRHSSILTVVPLTSRAKAVLPTHVLMDLQQLKCTSTAICEQLTALDKSKLIRKIGHVTDTQCIEELKTAMSAQLNLID